MAAKIARRVAELRAHVTAWRANGQSVGLVPTMGALHDGHLSLVRRSLARTGRTIVSLFVNPKQFAPGEDFDTYPRDEADDAGKLAAMGAHLLFAPKVEEIFPDGFAAKVSVPGLGDILEGECRPGFFDGVATVVTKLLLQAGADRAFFGEKDYQQLLIIKRLVGDLDIPVAIEAAPTVREADGLALSSRNAYLSEDQRACASALFRTLSAMAEGAAKETDIAEMENWAGKELLDGGFTRVDYITLRDAETLAQWAGKSRPGRALAAAWLGRTRLIDNVAV
ncbi:MAG TPA: pantoate--beta-alanine ligase [Rhodospirillales bacterium]|jgi:pantoate--beta-alanine ligase|nr:pantoate--beta-alanine ligase [Rhodospirillales bacterium]|tara:strand:+ start:746 stop:1588 length:843 start_codon:yes stop_codon:yes gene_type:complete